MTAEMIEVRAYWQERLLTARTVPGREFFDLADLGLSGLARRPLGQLSRYIRGPEPVRLVVGEALTLQLQIVPRPPQVRTQPMMNLESAEVIGALIALISVLIMAGLTSLWAPPVLQGDSVRETTAIAHAHLQFYPVAKVAPVIAPVPASAAPAAAAAASVKPVHVIPRASAPNLLSAFTSRGVRERLNRALGDDLSLAAKSATGHGGEQAGSHSGPELKDVGSGLQKGTVGLAPVGLDHGLPSRLGGLGQKGTVQIHVGGVAGEEFSSGRMDREAIRRVIREHLREIRSCYERELQHMPDLYGKVSLQWDIVAGGRVENARIHSNALSTPKVGECLVAHLREWKFPAPPRDEVGRIVYPFVFSER